MFYLLPFVSSKCTIIKYLSSLLLNPAHRAYSSALLTSSTNSVILEAESPRVNELGIQLIPIQVREHIFGKEVSSESRVPIHRIQQNLINHGIDYSKGSVINNVPKVPLIPLQGENIEEHFENISYKIIQPYLSIIDKLTQSAIPTPPNKWSTTPGWTVYHTSDGIKRSVPIKFPPDDHLVLDVEVCMAAGQLPVMATAVSSTNWYSWVSPYLFATTTPNTTTFNDDDNVSQIYNMDDLIPISDNTSDRSLPRIIVGHNVSFDRQKLSDQYHITQSGLYFIDTLAIHTCINGLTSHQKGKWVQKATEIEGVEDTRDDWMMTSSPGSLDRVYELYCNDKLDKRDIQTFTKGTINDVREHFQELMSYCARDVQATFNIFKIIFPIFVQNCPNPVTLVGMMEMGNSYLPVRKSDWTHFLNNCSSLKAQRSHEVSHILLQLANQSVELIHNNAYLRDPWLSELDWSVKVTKSKNKVTNNNNNNNNNNDNNNIIWYKENFITSKNISSQLRIVPSLLRLCWNDHPLYYVEHLGWGYIIPHIDTSDSSLMEDWMQYLGLYCKLIMPPATISDILVKTQEAYEKLNQYANSSQNKYDVIEYINNIKDNELGIKTKKIVSKVLNKAYQTPFGVAYGTVRLPGFQLLFDFYRIPHKAGEESNCGKPLSKDYETSVANGILRSRLGDYGHRILTSEKSISFWRSNCKRIYSQMVVSNKLDSMEENLGDNAVILPTMAVVGTVTRRAVQNTWLTASNPDIDKIGSELKTLITAPTGYSLVGADVDSQELWIASLLADSHYAGVHGSTPIGWMTLQGNKTDGTDVHSRTAETLGVTRHQAKVINYARIYGSGIELTIKQLKQYLPNASHNELNEKVKQLYLKTKGTRSTMHTKTKYMKKVWAGGTESDLFNRLDQIAMSAEPRTPALDCKISSSLISTQEKQKNEFYRSRSNWVVQSSGADYLHLLLVSMKWLINEYKITGRYSISVHDDIRFLVHDKDRLRAALALQLSNMYTRCLFAYKVGIMDLPQSVSFFSSVEIDRVLRKDPNDECITPSNHTGISSSRGIDKGLSLDIHSLLNDCKTL